MPALNPISKQNMSDGPISRKLARTVQPTGREVTFSRDEFIVSKTDLRGHIIYANEVFLRVAGLSEDEVIGAPHSIIRHPDMPRCVFKYLWETIEAGNEIFAYVINLAKSGDHYWVFAHVTPSFDAAGNIIGFHSNRRVAPRGALAVIEPLYATLREIETKSSDRKEGMMKAYQHLVDLIGKQGVSYDEFIFSI